MGRAKLPRKSTNIDMTAMCDVAFLLLSFFILTTKFKPSEAIAVTIPKSVAAKVAPSKDIVQVIIDKDGKVFLEMDDETVKETIANTLNNTKGMNLDVKAFKRSAFFGSSGITSQFSLSLVLPMDLLLLSIISSLSSLFFINLSLSVSFSSFFTGPL